MNISPMILKDLDGVMVVEKISFAIPWSRKSFENELIYNKLAYYLTAKDENSVIGYGGMWKILDEGHITNIAVHPSAQKKGVASKILNEFLKKAKSEGVKTLTLEVRTSNIPAQKLYEKFGFEYVGKRVKYYADNQEDAFIMTLYIKKFRKE